MKHDIVIDNYAKSQCPTPGHYDIAATCSCGWKHTLSHGNGDISRMILNHRVVVLEEATGIKVTIKSKS